MRIFKWIVVVLAVVWIFFAEWRFLFLYRCMDNVADQLVLQNVINAQTSNKK